MQQLNLFKKILEDSEIKFLQVKYSLRQGWWTDTMQTRLYLQNSHSCCHRDQGLVTNHIKIWLITNI